MKGTKTSPWAYGKGKPLTQSLGSGSNANALAKAMSNMNALPPEMSGKMAYPGDIFQDVLSQRLQHSAQPTQAVMSDMLPAVYKAPVAPPVKPSYPSSVIQDELAHRISKPNFTMGNNYPAPALIDDVAKPAMGMVDDVIKAAPQVAKSGARVGMGTMLGAGLPGVMDIVLPNHAYASTGDEVKKMREEEFYKRYPSKPDAELMKMLGIKTPEINMSEMTGEQAVTQAPFQSIGRMAQQQLPSGAGQEIESEAPVQNSAKLTSSNSTSHSGPVGSLTNASMGNPRMQLANELMEDDGDQYKQLAKMQQEAIGRKLAGRSDLSYMDLSPAMAFVDQLTHSNLSKNYKAPTGPEGDMANMNALSKQLADYDNDKEKNKIALLNALKEKQDPVAMEMMRQANRLELASMRNNMAQDAGLKPKDIVAVKEKFDKNDRVKNMDSYLNFNQKLDSYLSELDKMGDSNFAMTGEGRANLDRAYNDLIVNYNRDEAKLGALAGADINILKNVLKPVTGVGGAVNAFVGGGAQSAKDAIREFQKLSKSKAEKELEAIGQVYPQDIVGDQLGLYRNRINQMKVPKTTPPLTGKTPGGNGGLAAELAKRGLGKKK